MRKIYYAATIILATISLVAFNSCSGKPVLKVSSTTCAFDAVGSTKTIMVATDADLWSADFTESNDDHFSLKIEDDRLEITAKDNFTANDIKSQVKVTAHEATLLIDILQVGMTDKIYIAPNKDKFEVGAGEGSMYLSVNSLEDWKVSYDSEWCVITADMVHKRVLVSYDKNTKDEARSVTLKFVAADDTHTLKTITIEQISPKNDPYYAIIGNWDMYCDKWSSFNAEDAENDLGAGAFTKVMIKELIPYVSYSMEDFFMPSMVNVLFFNKDDNSLSFPGGQPCGIINRNTYTLVGYNPTEWSFDTLSVTGKASEDYKTISFDLAANRTFGFFQIAGRVAKRIADFPYPKTNKVEWRWSEKQPVITEGSSLPDISGAAQPLPENSTGKILK